MDQTTATWGFSKLPYELRHNIWLLCISHTRILEIKWNAKENKYYTDEERPAVMLICRESRNLSHHLYDYVQIEPKVYIPDMVMGRRREVSARFRVFVNYELDTLYLRTSNSPEEPRDRMVGFASALARHDGFKGKCKKIAIDSRAPERIFRSLFMIYSLRTMLSICGDENRSPDPSSLPTGNIIEFNRLSAATAFRLRDQHLDFLGDLDSTDDIQDYIEEDIRESFRVALRGTRELFSVRAIDLGRYGIPNIVVGEMARSAIVF